MSVSYSTDLIAPCVSLMPACTSIQQGLKKRERNKIKKARCFLATLVCCLHAVDFGKEQQIEISVGAHESETTIFRHVNLCWSKVHAISPMLPGNDLVKRLLLSFGRWEHIRFLLLYKMIGKGGGAFLHRMQSCRLYL